MFTILANFITSFAAVHPCQTGEFFGLPPWYKYLDRDPSVQGRCSISFDFPEDIGAVLFAVAEIMLRVGALVAIGFVVYGGVLYMVSRGEPEKTREARNTVVNAIIGLVIAVASTALVTYIAGRFN